jgi:DNA-binding MarR family transcriptional regulator
VPFTQEKEIRLLILLKEGKCQKDIASRLKLAPSVINYHVKKFLKKGFITEVFDQFNNPTSPKLYSLTSGGETHLKLKDSILDSTFSLGGEKDTVKSAVRPRFLMHHAQYKYPIKKDAPIQMSVEVHMKNWTKKIDEWKYCKVVKSDKSLIFHIKNLYGNEPHELLLRSQNIANKMASIYEDNWGMELGRPTMMGTPHWKDLWDDETWAEYSKFVSVETPSGFIDKTPPEGGLEFKSAESASNYVNMSDNVVKVMGKVGKLEDKVEEQTGVLTQIRDVLDAFVKSQTYEKLPEKDEKKDVA